MRARRNSVQPELRADRLEFRRLDEACMSYRHRMKQAIEFARPEVEELLELGEMRMQVVLLPDEVLQNVRVIGHSIKDTGGRQSKPLELTAEVGAGHADLLIPRVQRCHLQRILTIIGSAKTVPNQSISS